MKQKAVTREMMLKKEKMKILKLRDRYKKEYETESSDKENYKLKFIIFIIIYFIIYNFIIYNFIILQQDNYNNTSRHRKQLLLYYH